MTVEAKFRHTGYQSGKFTFLSHPLQTLEKKSKDHKSKNSDPHYYLSRSALVQVGVPLRGAFCTHFRQHFLSIRQVLIVDARLFIPTLLPKQKLC